MSSNELRDVLNGMKDDDHKMTKSELQEAFRDALNDPNLFDYNDDSGHKNPILILKPKTIKQIDNCCQSMRTNSASCAQRPKR